MFLSDEMVLGNGVIVCESEGIRLGMGRMVSGSEEMKEADFVSASCRLVSDAINSNLTRVLFAFRVTFSSFFVFRFFVFELRFYSCRPPTERSTNLNPAFFICVFSSVEGRKFTFTPRIVSTVTASALSTALELMAGVKFPRIPNCIALPCEREYIISLSKFFNTDITSPSLNAE